MKSEKIEEQNHREFKLGDCSMAPNIDVIDRAFRKKRGDLWVVV